MKTNQNSPSARPLNLAIKMFILCLVQANLLPGTIEAQSSQTTPWVSLRVTLYGYNADGSKYVADGVMVNYADQFSNYVDDNDAEKLFGSSPSLAIDRNDTMLVIERRHTITTNDTIPLSLKGASAANYMFELSGSAFQAGLVASVYDSYANCSYTIDLLEASDIPFRVTGDAASKAANRFSVNIAPASILPINFTFFNAMPNGKNIDITWSVNGANNAKQYIVQHSVDGINFGDYFSENATAGNAISKSYEATFTGAKAGNHFFRVESIDNYNKISFTKIISVSVAGNAKAGIYCVATDNSNIRLVYNNLQAGNYNVEVVNAEGQIFYSRQQTVRDANGNLNLHIQPTVHGLYYVTLRGAKGVQASAVVL